MIDNIFFSRKRLSSFLKKEKIYLSKSKGQNFLLDKNIISKMFLSIESTKEDIILEIGAGIGHLSEKIIEYGRYKKYILVEIDKKFVKILEERFSSCPNVEIQNKDFLKYSIKEVWKKYQSKIIIIGNLPYCKVGLIIRQFIINLKYINKIYITVQKEVGQRMIAISGNKSYGFLSVLIQIYTKIRFLFILSSKVFFPIPKVQSIFLEIIPQLKNISLLEDKKLFFEVLKNIFLYRRKRIKKVLQEIYGVKEDYLRKILKEKENKILLMRIENLTKEEIINFINSIVKIIKQRDLYVKKH